MSAAARTIRVEPRRPQLRHRDRPGPDRSRRRAQPPAAGRAASHHCDRRDGGAALRRAGSPPRSTRPASPQRSITVPAGESSKEFAAFGQLMNELLDRRPDRKTTLVALGGGVVGDLTGFAAAMLLRGVDFIQVPTTLLAQVDSSVGGKTGINTRHGKNLVGAFYQPRLVLADTDVLDTLPKRELLAGYAEVAKYGLIDDAGLLRLVRDEWRGRAVGRCRQAHLRHRAELPRQGPHRGGRRARDHRPARPAQSRPYLRPCARGRDRLRPRPAARRGGGRRHGDGLRPVGPPRPLSGRRCRARAPSSRRRRPADAAALDRRRQPAELGHRPPDRPHARRQEGRGAASSPSSWRAASARPS